MALPHIDPYPLPAALPASRAGWTPDPARAALLIHDMQHYFVAAFPAQHEPIRSVVPAIADLRRHARAAGMPVIFSTQPGDQAPAERGLLRDFWGAGLATGQQAAIITDLQPQPDELVLTKWRYSAFQRTDLAERLRALGRDQLIICGVYAHLGCLLTACDAFMHDIAPFFVADAVADFSAEEHRWALRYAAGRCAVVTDTARLLQQLGLTQLRRELADLLDEPASIALDDDLRDWGLDSLRLMTVAERWRSAGCNADLAALASAPTLRAWYALRFGQPSPEPAV